MQRPHHHGPMVEGDLPRRPRTGSAGGKTATSSGAREYLLVAAFVLSAVLTYLGARNLHRAHQGDEYPDSVMDLPTCHARLAALGLDFGDSGSMRLSVSKWAIDRRRIYEGMGSGVRAHGVTLGGVVTQGLRQDDLFRIYTDSRSNRLLISPLLHPLEVPVRAMILPLRDAVAAGRIRDTLRQVLLPAVAPGTIWLQDDKLYHATLYHASSHMKPIHASAAVIAEEERAIRRVAASTCPIHAVLDRVIITATGVVVACWQVLPNGGEPALLREALGKALPNAPPRDAQMVREPAILHTTIARLLQPPPELVQTEEEEEVEEEEEEGQEGEGSGGAAAGGQGARTRRRLLGQEGVGTGALRGAGDEGVVGLQGGRQGGAREGEAAGAGAGGDGASWAGVGAGSGRQLLAAGGAAHSAGQGGTGVVREGRAVAAAGRGSGPLETELVVAAVDAISGALCGLRATFTEVWFIEEQDLLALALDGAYVRHLAPLSCPGARAVGDRRD